MPRISLCQLLIEAWKAGRRWPRHFGEVAAGDEVLLRRGDDDALHRRIGQRLLHGLGIGTHRGLR
jgi:hypothetical protein